MMAWVPAMFSLAVLIETKTGYFQEVHMVDSNTRGLFLSTCRSIRSVLTSLVGSALLI